MVLIVTLGPAQTILAQPAGSPAPAASSAPVRKSPIVSRMQAHKVVPNAQGQDTLEDAANVSPGDVVQYSATHRNISGKRLLAVDFAIAVPYGTRYVAGSAQPDTGVLAANPKGGQQVVWRIERIEPAQAITLRMRMLIEPDPTLTPVPAPVRKPEIRR